MAWKGCNAVEERLRFIARLLDGEKMASLCRQFGISRKTGYKTFNRYTDCGIDGLTDRSRRPDRQASQLPMQIEKLIVGLKKEYLYWGAPKIREKLMRLNPAMHCPANRLTHCSHCSWCQRFLPLAAEHCLPQEQTHGELAIAEKATAQVT